MRMKLRIKNRNDDEFMYGNTRKDSKVLTPEWRYDYPRSVRRGSKHRSKAAIATIVMQVILVLIGLLFLAYPVYADWLTQKGNDNIIADYTSYVQKDTQQIADTLNNAYVYNERLALAAGVSSYDPSTPFPISMDIPIASYWDQVITGEGAFAWIEFPLLNARFPIYHGTSDEALMQGVGHVEDTSLPVGGLSTHAGLTGHSGMTSTRMFDDIRQLNPGDIFYVHVMGQKLGYKVYNVEVVLPEDVRGKLSIERGRDLVTLITCHPYGVNTHRLLVHAERCSVDDELIPPNQSPMAPTGDNSRLLPLLFAIMLLAALIVFYVMYWHRRPCEIYRPHHQFEKKFFGDRRRFPAGYFLKASYITAPKSMSPPSCMKDFDRETYVYDVDDFDLLDLDDDEEDDVDDLANL